MPMRRINEVLKLTQSNWGGWGCKTARSSDTSWVNRELFTNHPWEILILHVVTIL